MRQVVVACSNGFEVRFSSGAQHPIDGRIPISGRQLGCRHMASDGSVNKAEEEVFSFGDLDRQVNAARRSFRELAEPQRREIEETVGLLFLFLRSIGKFKTIEEWKGSRDEDVLMILIKSLQTTMGMLYLSESGFYDMALVLKRNYSELMLQAIAVSSSDDLYVKWKHHRKPFDDLHKIARAIEAERSALGDLRADLAKQLVTYWNESSALHSHQLGKKSVEDALKEGKFRLGASIATEEFQAGRLRTVRNMCLNVLSLLIQSFDYGGHAAVNADRFPEAPALISRFNALLRRTEELSEPTV